MYFDARCGQFFRQRARGHVVALLNRRYCVRDVLVGHVDFASLHLLEAQPLVDQLVRDLRGQPVEDIRRSRHAGREGEQAATIVEIALADDVAVHHGHNRRAIGRLRGRLRAGHPWRGHLPAPSMRLRRRKGRRSLKGPCRTFG